MAEALSTLERGHADALIVGATGTRIHPVRSVHIAIQEELARADDDPATACRPFEKDRRGMVLGEGAAALVLETLDHAEKRGANIVAEVVGVGSSAVRDPLGVANEAKALENSMRRALQMAGMKPQDIGHVHAHGVGTRGGDEQEAQAIAAVFGNSSSVPVTAAKSYIGNIGAAGGLAELVASLLAMKQGELFPILNFVEADPACPIRPAPGGRCGGRLGAESQHHPAGTGQRRAAAAFRLGLSRAPLRRLSSLAGRGKTLSPLVPRGALLTERRADATAPARH